MRPNFFPMLGVLLSLVSSRRRFFRVSEKFNRENDPIRYMRELEFRNTIDQYDLAVVLFFKKDVDDCKRMLPGFKYAAYKSRGRADFIAIAAKSAADLCDELGVEKFPTLFSFRHGHLVEKLEGDSSAKQIFYYVKNVTNSKYKYLNEPSEARPMFLLKNATLVVAVPTVDARLDKLLAVVSAKFHKELQVLIATTPAVAQAFGVSGYPSITLLRVQDDNNITFPGDLAKATVKSLTDFVDKNVKPKYELILKFLDLKEELGFVALFDTADRRQAAQAREILERVATDHGGSFWIRYGDAPLMRRNITDLNLQNLSTPIFLFAKKDNFGYKKWVYKGELSPAAVSAFCADQLRGRNPETIISYPLDSRRKRQGLRFMTGEDLKKSIEKNPKKDFVVNFVGFPCLSCDQVDNLFEETAAWAAHSGIKSVVFARVNASCNDVPTSVWRNETFPYGWFFPSTNRTAAFPIGKRRQLYWMAHLLKDNMTEPFRAELPTKPEKTPYIKREDNL